MPLGLRPALRLSITSSFQAHKPGARLRLSAEEQILDILRRAGWITAAHRSSITDMGFAEPRVEQMLAGRPRPAPPPFAKDDPTGVTRFAIVSN